MEESNNENIDIYNAWAVGVAWWRRKVTFVYIDTPDHKADNLIDKRGIRVRYLDDAFKDGEPYYVCACRVPKKRLVDFLDAMYELQNVMLICGYHDYEEYCNTVREMMFERLTEDE